MKGKNRRYSRSRISECKFKKIIRLFVDDLSASTIAESTNLSRPTINKLLFKLRIRIAQSCVRESPLAGKLSIDDSSLNDELVNGRFKRGVKGTKIVFCQKVHDDKVYTEIVRTIDNKKLKDIKRQVIIAPGSLLVLDSLFCYEYLVGRRKDDEILFDHGSKEDFNVARYVVKVESFLKAARDRLVKFNGIPENTFFLHFKECEFRFNIQKEVRYYEILDLLKKEPL